MIDERNMQLATDWRGESLDGWLWSEKLNGCRVHWDGAQFWTRHGRQVAAPKWFTRGLPKGIVLDGEIWAGRDGKWGMDSFNVAQNAVRLGGRWFDEGNIRFTAFDAPQVSGGWAVRMAEVKRAVKRANAADAIKFGRVPIATTFAENVQFGIWLAGFGNRNCEGVMFRDPEAGYDAGRSRNLVRVKFAGN